MIRHNSSLSVSEQYEQTMSQDYKKQRSLMWQVRSFRWHLLKIILWWLSPVGKDHSATGHENPGGGNTCITTLSVNSALDGSEWSTPYADRFTPGKDSVPLRRRLGLDGCGKSCPHRDSILGPSIP